MSCLSDVDLDLCLRPILGDRVFEARQFFDVRTNRTSAEGFRKAIVRTLEDRDFVVVPAHIRHHWATSIFVRVNGEIRVVLYDSCPSLCSQEEFEREFRRFRFPFVYRSHCKQVRGTDTCGLHVILLALICRHHGPNAIRETDLMVDLTSWRKPLAASPQRASLLELCSLVPEVRKLFEIEAGATEEEETVAGRLRKQRETTLAQQQQQQQQPQQQHQQQTTVLKDQKLPHEGSSPDVNGVTESNPPAKRPRDVRVNNPYAVVVLGDDDNDDDDDDDDDNSVDDARDAILCEPLSSKLFQKGDAMPGRVQPHLLTGEFLKQIVVDDLRTPEMSKQGLAKTTRKVHMRALKWSTLPSLYPERLYQPLPSLLVDVYTMRSQERKWKNSTLVTNMVSCQGALALLPMYTRHLPQVMLKDCPMWVQAVKGASKRMREEVANQSKPATWENVEQAMQKETNDKVKFAMLVSWLTCGRVGDILQLKNENVRDTERGLAVQFRKGKGVQARKTAYTVHTCQIPNQWKAKFKNFLRNHKYNLFSNTHGKQIKVALRRIDPLLEQRSLRRGSLQCLARVGQLPPEKMILFSGHSNVAMLMRYLDFGMLAPKEQTKESAEAAARICLPCSVVYDQ
jgi:integrase